MKRALIVWGGWEGHQPGQCVERFAPWLQSQGFNLTIANSLGVFEERDLLQSLNLVVLAWTMARPSQAQERGLLQAIENGTGFVTWHGSIDSFYGSKAYSFMIGAHWVAHPGDIVDYEVNIANCDDPITSALPDFHVRSEQYYMHVDPSNQVLATTTFGSGEMPWLEGVVMPVAWKRYWNAGRVFYCALGHSASMFDTPALRDLMHRGLLWAGTRMPS